MAPSKTRQRALARAKLERQIARRAVNARRRRQIQAMVGAVLAVVLIVAGVVWATGGFDSKPKKSTTAAAEDCTWTQQQPSDKVKDVGKPPTTGIPKAGTAAMTITTNQGTVEAELDRAGAPCTAASFGYLASKKFFDNTKCHRLTTSGIFVLQCGDPSGTGSGGPAYKFPDEHLPTPAEPSASASADPAAGQNLYPAGTLAMANSGPNTNGSQFFVVYKDGSGLQAKYTVFGKITKGLDIVQKIAAGGVNPGSSETDGEPKTGVTIQSLTVAAAPAAAPATPAPTASGAGS